MMVVSSTPRQASHDNGVAMQLLYFLPSHRGISYRSALNRLVWQCKSFDEIQPLCSLLQPSVVETSTGLNPNPTQQSFGCPRPSNHLSSRCSLGLRLHNEPTFFHEAAAFPEPPQQQNNTRTADTNAPSSAASLHPSVLTDRRIHLPNPAPTSLSTDQASVVQTSMAPPQTAQQPAPFEQMNQSLHRPAGTSAVNTEVSCQDDRVHPGSAEDGQPPEHHTTHQWVTSKREERHGANIRCELKAADANRKLVIVV